MEQPGDWEADDDVVGEATDANGDSHQSPELNRLAAGSMPQRPPFPNRPAPRPGFPWAVLFALFGVVGCLVLLVFLSQGLLLPLAFVAAAIFMIGGLHYIVWGWWLGSVIRREEAEDEEP